MPRNSRCVLPGVTHHITQRGSNRQDVFFSQQDRSVYLDLVSTHAPHAAARILGYCLMTDHVHWVVIPNRPDSLALLFRRVHGRYSQYLNARRGRTGHLWQNRYFSCTVACEREPAVLRYVENNPVRAGMVETPDAYPWSSAAAHVTGPECERVPLLDWDYWTKRGGAEGWRESLRVAETVRDVVAVRQSTYAGSPLGPADFVADMERIFDRQWRLRGRQPRKPAGSAGSEKGTEASAAFSGA